MLLCAPLDLLTLEEEEEDEDEEGTGVGGTGAFLEDEEWLGRLCDEEDDEEGFFFFLTDVGASYVRKDSKDMVGFSKSSSSSLDGEPFGTRCRPGKQRQWEDEDRSSGRQQLPERLSG